MAYDAEDNLKDLDDGYGSKPLIDTCRRTFTPLPRHTACRYRHYDRRSALEHVNSRLGRSFGFERHFIRGIKKMTFRTAFAVGWIKAGRPPTYHPAAVTNPADLSINALFRKCPTIMLWESNFRQGRHFPTFRPSSLFPFPVVPFTVPRAPRGGGRECGAVDRFVFSFRVCHTRNPQTIGTGRS